LELSPFFILELSPFFILELSPFFIIGVITPIKKREITIKKGGNSY
jgi:hypothetical protein